ncbi:MAG TPA: cupin domain-containing protein [Candidatus Binatia bacterium]|nr:cupin domain-containing protein [Candidatus Binatia bacterium]
MRARLALYVAAVCLCSATVLSAQDAVKVDPKHYSVVTENDQVRILKVHYGAHEKSVMHSHPNAVAVFLTDAKGTFTFPDGKKQDFAVKAGDSQYSPAGTHLPENTGDKEMEVIVTELKGKTAKAAPGTKAEPAKATKK